MICTNIDVINNITGIIYKITCLLNNKIYIGKTTETLEARIKNHIRASAHYTEGFLTVSPLYEDIQKYGVSNFSCC